MTVTKSKKPTKKGDLISFPKRRETDHLTREEVLKTLEEAGFNIDRALLKFMRLTRFMIRGVHEKFEFFDVLSNQPFVYKEENSPPICFNKKKKAPSWVQQRYLSITEEEGKIFLTFIDAPRKVFIKDELINQDLISHHIYQKIMGIKE